jgi:1-acyl-sn-glycerol-3-phosphate acyltransferase
VHAQSPFVYALGRVVFGVLFHRWIRAFRVMGAENVPTTGGLFVIANHASGLDPFILGYGIQHRYLRGPGKAELFENRPVGWILSKLGIFPLRRDGVDAGGTRTMVELIRSGQAVAVYPEGARSTSGELLPFSPSFARLAIKLKVQLVPAGIAGAGYAVPIGTYVPRRDARIAVVYGQPFDLSQFYGRELSQDHLSEASELMRERVAALVARAQRLKD